MYFSNSQRSRLLPTPGGTGDREQPHRAAVGARVEELLDETQLGVAPDERGLEALLALLARDAGDHARRPPQSQRLGLALDHVLAAVLIGDRLRGHLARGLVDVDRAGLGDALHTSGGVHAIAHHQRLGRVVARRDLARDHAGARPQPGRADFLAEHADLVHQLQSRTYRPLRVVLARHRRAPDRHHRVADELLDGAAVTLDDRACGLEVAPQELANVLGVAGLGEARVADHVDEQDRDEAHLRRDDRARIGHRRRGPERRPALVAELLIRTMPGPAGGAAQLQRRAALVAELRALSVLHLAGGTDHSDSLAPERGPSLTRPQPAAEGSRPTASSAAAWSP